MEIRKIKVTVTNLPVTLVLAFFLSRYGRVEDFDAVQGTVGAMVGDYSFMCYRGEGFNAIPDIITNNT